MAISWRRGMATLGAGMGAAILILVLYAGHRLWDTPLAWAVVVQAADSTAEVPQGPGAEIPFDNWSDIASMRKAAA